MSQKLKPYDNPFSTQKIENLQYIDQYILKQLLRDFEKYKYRAAIVGKQGSGKTRLLEELLPKISLKSQLLSTEGSQLVKSIDLLSGIVKNQLLVLDGFDSLKLYQRYLVLILTKIFQKGLLITLHHPKYLKVLVTSQVELDLAYSLVKQLDNQIVISKNQIASIMQSNDDNLRELFFDLYDQKTYD